MPFNAAFLSQLRRSPGAAAGLSLLKKFGSRPQALLPLLLIGLGSGGDPVQAAPTFGVVRQEVRSDEEWMTVRQQLNRRQVPFQSLEASDLDEDTLPDLQILFLPNPGRLEVEQVQALGTWLKADSGHQLILAGPLQVPANQEREMRQLLGAYWNRPLTTAAAVEVTNFESAAWAEAITETGPVKGGELLPTGLESRLIASWEAGAGSSGYAVIATQQTVYLGWIWGENPELDEQWLQAALQRAGERRESSSEIAAAEEELGLEVIQPQPLSPLEALAMRQELLGLVGRIESAFLVTQATQGQSTAVPPGATFQAILRRAEEVARQLPAWAERGESQRARQEFDAVLKDLWASYPVESLTTLPEVRAIWLDRGTIVEAGSERGLVQVFDRLAQAGINTVFFETINAGYPIYPSRVAPTQNPLTRGWDPLAAAVKLAHERDIELHSWIWTFAVGNQRHNVLPEIGLPEAYPGPVLSQYPEWANLDDRGEMFPRGQPQTWIDPANPEVRRYVLDLIEELVDYGVDGIHLDYIRYPFQNAAGRITFGYGAAARQQFQTLTGVDPLDLDPLQDRSLWGLWTQFRTDQVNGFVQEAARSVRRLNPDVILSAAVFALPDNERQQKLQQDWETWVNAGDIDLLVPMTYTLDTRRLAQMVEPNLDIVSRSPILFLPSLKLLEMPKVEFLDQMQVVRDLPTGGYALFAVRHLTDELQEVLRQSSISSAQVPYRQPFLAAQARFAVLEQEWEFLLEQEEITIFDPERSQWMQSVAETSAALEALAANPSSERLRVAQSSMQTFQQQFSNWMRLDALQHPYRISTWLNRMAAIEVLLRYGERTALPSDTSGS
jgi:uncharacterized lipoprotein YddW (UPF0748 family)